LVPHGLGEIEEISARKYGGVVDQDIHATVGVGLSKQMRDLRGVRQIGFDPGDPRAQFGQGLHAAGGCILIQVIGNDVGAGLRECHRNGQTNALLCASDHGMGVGQAGLVQGGLFVHGCFLVVLSFWLIIDEINIFILNQ
jgi:hypothetical protein